MWHLRTKFSVVLACASACLCASFAARAAVFTSELVTHLPPAGGASFSSSPSQGVTMGGFFYFSASDGANGTRGRELWRTDGTSNGTMLVKDIRPGAADSSPELLTVAGTNLFFVANDGTHGKELWRSDGTPGGTKLVADLSPGSADSSFGPIKPANAEAYFSLYLNFGSGPSPLFKSDRTAGIIQLTGPGGSLMTNEMTAFDTSGGNAVFSATSASGSDLWYTDGTLAGTTLLESLSGTNIFDVLVLEPKCYYITSASVVNSNGDRFTYTRLFRRDLTPGGSSESLDSATGCSPASACLTSAGINSLRAINDRLYYIRSGRVLCNTPPTFRCSFSSDYSVGNSSSPESIDFDFRGLVGILDPWAYFAMGQGIYRSDGTDAGTTLVLDMTPLGIFPSQYRQAGSRFFFDAWTNSSAPLPTQIGVTDLTTEGTRIVWEGSRATILGALGDNAFFSGNDDLNGEELWITDGTTAGSRLLKDIAPGSDNPPPTEAVTVGNTYFLSVETPSLGRELWRSDGTAPGTSLVRDIQAGALGSNPSNFVAWNGLLYFVANDGANGVELWRSDGTESGTFMVKDTRVGPAGGNPSALTPAGTLLFFVADDGARGAELWRSDGTSNGTFMAEDIVPGLDPGQIGNLSAVGNIVYFIAKSGSAGRELWFSTGQPGGTQFLKDLNAGSGDSAPSQFTAFGGAAYFVNGAGSTGLWRTDATPSGTTLVKPGPFSKLQVAGASLFAALSENFTSFSQLWKSDGSSNGTVMITNLPGTIHNLIAVDSNVFLAETEDLWISDGTVNGTRLAADFSDLGSSANYPQQLRSFLGALLFVAGTPSFGRELWATAAGQTATLVEDLEPGNASADIRFLAPVLDKAFYVTRLSGQPTWQVRALRLQSLDPPARSPWNGSPASAPGRIEAEHFDIGGEGRAYHDTTIVNEGGQFRKTEAVDLQVCNDVDAGFCVTHTRPEEWLEYTFQTGSAGLYVLKLRAASSGSGATFHLAIDGVTFGGTNAIPDTGSAWTNVSLTPVEIASGIHVLRLTFDSASSSGSAGSVNWLELELITNGPPMVTIDYPTQDAIIRPGFIVLSATITDTTTDASPSAEFFIDDQFIGAVSAPPYQRFWIATTGAHVLRVRATDSFGLSSVSQGRRFFVFEPIVPLGSAWHYAVLGEEADPNWMMPNYNDSFWESGFAELGFGDGDEATVLPSGEGLVRYVTYYFRTRFDLPNAAQFNYAKMTLVRDDGAIVYLNGQEVGRFNLPAGPVDYFTRASASAEQAINTFSVPVSALVNGQNVIAVEMHQFGVRPDGDLSFDLSFTAFTYHPDPRLTIEASASNAIVRWLDHLTDWQLQQSTDLVNWTDVTETPIPINGFLTVTLPMSAHAFFRLRNATTP